LLFAQSGTDRPATVNCCLAWKAAAKLSAPRLALVAQWTSPDTIGADELFWRGVLDPRDRALAISLPAPTGQWALRKNLRPQRPPTEEAR
jgi:hypothetical protein